MGNTFPSLKSQLEAMEDLEQGGMLLSTERRKKAIDAGFNLACKYNIGIVGYTGTGKSSLINNVRGFLHESDVDYAKVDFTESTQFGTKYIHPEFKAIEFWDIPGYGTVDHPFDKYFEDHYLDAFDILVIVVHPKLRDDDIKLAKRAKKANVPYIFVFTKVNLAVDTKLQHCKQCTYEEAKSSVREKIKSNMESEAKKKWARG